VKINISFSALSHTGHSCNTIPYGIATVATYALKNCNDTPEAELFKDPVDLIASLENNPSPHIACFSSYIWNVNLSYEFAKQIKIKSPRTVVIFGGPNYPLDTEEQEKFLLSHPCIDFHINREGEEAFVKLFNKLLEYDFNITKIIQSQLNIPNCHYISSGRIVQGDQLSPLANLNDIPSPYLSGLLDKFLKSKLVPLIQFARGCPFKCTFCQEGHEYYDKTRRFSYKRINDELEYIAQRTTVPNLILADSNFGQYKNDLEICKAIASIQNKYSWPKYFHQISGKNNKDRVIEAVSIIRSPLNLGTAVQSTDEKVLRNIKRTNVSKDKMIQIAKEGENYGANSFSEVILSLPGDTKESHYNTIFELIDAEINVVRSHQFIMLPGSESATIKSRKQYGMEIRFRIVPNTVHSYKLFNKVFFAPEIDEICVANNSMSFEDYQECRLLNLTIEIFYNDCIFQEFIKFLKMHNIQTSSFILNIHRMARNSKSKLFHLYKGFLKETNELWNSREELEKSFDNKDIAAQYMSEEIGKNEQVVYRSLAIFKHMENMHDIVFGVTREMLEEKNSYTDQNRSYLEELFEFSMFRKKNILSNDLTKRGLFHYDFAGLIANNFNDNPFSYYSENEIEMEFCHNNDQKEIISRYIDIFGTSDYGLGNILNTAPLNNFYRMIKKV